MRFLDWLKFFIEDESGFLGFGGGTRKKEAVRTMGDVRGLRGSFQDLAGRYKTMASDPSKLGLSPAIRSAMLARQGEMISGQQQRAGMDVNRRLASQGMSNTGAGIRATMAMAPQFAGMQREAGRDIDIANEQMQREELFKSMQGEAGAYGGALETFSPELAYQNQAYKSMWGPALTQIAGAAIGGIGYGLGSRGKK
jgi:hypothetical protein